MEETDAIIIRVEEHEGEDEGHSTLVVHGDSEIILQLAKLVTLTLAAGALAEELGDEERGPEVDVEAA